MDELIEAVHRSNLVAAIERCPSPETAAVLATVAASARRSRRPAPRSRRCSLHMTSKDALRHPGPGSDISSTSASTTSTRRIEPRRCWQSNDSNGGIAGPGVLPGRS